MKRVLFLDIDGVLNDHIRHPTGYTVIDRDRVTTLNKIAFLGVELVISSAWRYMIHGGALTLKGFDYLLKSHGVMMPVIGLTKTDEEIQLRDNQIEDWLQEHQPDKFAVIDDLPLNVPNFVQTNGSLGIRNEHIPLLRKFLT